MGSLNKRKNLLSAIKSIRGGSRQNQVRREPRRALPDLFLKCEGCKSVIDYKEFVEHLKICPECGYHMKMNGLERFEYLMDEGYEKISFGSELKDPISFPKYDEKRAKEEKKSGLNEAVSIVKGAIEGNPALVAVLELQYMMGSLGTYMGEELTKMFEYAISNELPVIVFSASGGARMQEGIFSLMQMAKTSAAIGKFQDAGLLYQCFDKSYHRRSIS